MSIRNKILVTAIGVLLVSLMATTLVVGALFSENYATVLRSNATTIGKSLAVQLDRLQQLGIPLEELTGFEVQCQETVDAHPEIAYAMVLSGGNSVLFSSRGVPDLPAASLPAGNKIRHPVSTETADGRYYDSLVPVLGLDQTLIGWIRVGVPVAGIREKTAGMLLTSVVPGVFSLIFGGLLLVVVMRRTVHVPLQGLLNGIQATSRASIAGDDAIEQVSDDEIGQIAKAFNEMLRRLAVSQDDLKRSLRKLEQRSSELSASNAELTRLAQAKDEFLATMSHELRTPLNAVLGLAEVIKRGLDGPVTDKQQRHLDTILKSGNHLLRLIEDILDIATIESGGLSLAEQPVDLRELCGECMQVVEPGAAPMNHRLYLEFDDAVKGVVCDPRRLKQVLINLLNNAIKFTPQGGSIGLEVRGDREAGQIRLTVSDTGIGIANDKLQLLFQPFQQIDSSSTRSYEGTGLGLALVYRLTDLHGGSVSVESTPGEGSRFTVVLPWHETDVPAPVRLGLKDRSDAVDGAGASVLLVEDNETNIVTVSVYLEALGFRVLVARDGREGVRSASEFQPDLILMDVLMPRLDGLEATRMLRAQPATRDIPIIALTALAMPGDREKCLAAGMQDYLVKPVDLQTLGTVLKRYLEPAGGMSGAVGLG